jgi:hypothetical protein
MMSRFSAVLSGLQYCGGQSVGRIRGHPALRESEHAKRQPVEGAQAYVCSTLGQRPSGDRLKELVVDESYPFQTPVL